MRRTIYASLAAAALLWLPGTVTGQIIGTGATQISLNGNLNFCREDCLTQAAGAAYVSLTHFATDNFEWGLASALSFDSDGQVGGLFGVLAQWNFTTQSLWLPYVGVSAGSGFSGGELLHGAGGSFTAGFRRFIGENVALNISTSQDWYYYSYEGVNEFEWPKFKSIPINFGFSVFLHH